MDANIATGDYNMVNLIILLCCAAIFAAGWYLGTISVLIELKSYGFTITRRDKKLIITLKKHGSTYVVREERDSQCK